MPVQVPQTSQASPILSPSAAPEAPALARARSGLSYRGNSMIGAYYQIATSLTFIQHFIYLTGIRVNLPLTGVSESRKLTYRTSKRGRNIEAIHDSLQAL